MCKWMYVSTDTCIHVTLFSDFFWRGYTISAENWEFASVSALWWYRHFMIIFKSKFSISNMLVGGGDRSEPSLTLYTTWACVCVRVCVCVHVLTHTGRSIHNTKTWKTRGNPVPFGSNLIFTILFKPLDSFSEAKLYH